MAGIRQPKKLDAERLWSYALRSLGARGMSSGEIRSKLQRRAENPSDIDAVLKRLKDYGYLNDQKFAEHYASARLETEGFGRQRVLRDLRQKRVAPGLAEKVVSETYADSDEVALIESFLARKYRNVNLGELLHDPSKLASVFRKLRYAGFSAGTSIRVLRRYSERAEELEDSTGDDTSPTPAE
jgi:regulatory protein